MKKGIFSFLVVTAMIATFVQTKEVYAAEENSQEGFSINAEIPTNQIDKNKNYFDLMVTPKQEQDLTVTVSNASETEETYIVEVNPATTSAGGVIDYSKKNAKSDKSAPFNIKDIAKLSDNEVTVAAHGEKKVNIHLSIPEKEFDGTVLGGIIVYKKNNAEATKKQNQNGVQIRNIYKYVMAISLKENSKEITPDLTLERVFPKESDYKPVIVAELYNQKPVVLGSINLVTTIYKEGQNKPYIHHEDKSLLMAPNSKMKYEFGLDGHELKPGNYSMDMSVNAEENKYSWHFTKKFTISKEETKQINSNSVFEDSEGTDWMLISLVIIVGILFLFIAYMVIKKLTKNK